MLGLQLSKHNIMTQLQLQYVKWCATCAADLCRLTTEDSEVLRLLALVDRELFVEWIDGVGDSVLVSGWKKHTNCTDPFGSILIENPHCAIYIIQGKGKSKGASHFLRPVNVHYYNTQQS